LSFNARYCPRNLEAENFVHLRIAEAQGRNPLTIHLSGAIQLLKGLLGEHTVVADLLDPEQAPVGLEADLS
jgi:hypothetical protein